MAVRPVGESARPKVCAGCGEAYHGDLCPRSLARFAETADGDVPDRAFGERFGRYVLVRELGRGGSGVVWLARDAKLGRPVALKILSGATPEDIARFEREAQTVASLHHPNIAPLYEFGRHEGRSFIAMQYVDGWTLQSFPRSDRRVLVDIVRRAALAVHYANEQGLIHRDLKPANIMVERSGSGSGSRSGLRVFVMDFGLARSMSVASALSATGMVVGTPYYMSPEQARGSPALDERTDVYALGATLYDVLAGRPAFEGTDFYDVLAKVVVDEPRPLRAANARIDVELETVVMKCLEKDPARRYQTALELAEDLERWLEGEPIQARPVSTWRRVARRIGRNRWLAVAVMVLMVAGLVVALQWRQSRRRLAEEQEIARRGKAALQRLATQWVTIIERKRELRQLRVPGARARRDLEAALREVDAHVRDWPDEPQGYYVRARGRMYLGDLDGAERDLRAALEKRPDFRPGWALLGVLKVEEYDQGIMGLQETQEERRTRLRPLLTEAAEAFQRGWEPGREREESQRWGLPRTREDEVMEQVARALRWRHHENDHERARTLLQEAMTEFKAEEYAAWLGEWAPTLEEDVRLQTQAIEWAPGYEMALFNRGTARRALGDLAGALADFDRAIEVREDFYDAIYNRALTRQDLRDYDGAIADYDRAIAIRDCGEGHNARGSAKQLQGDLEGAAADYERAIQIDPGFASPHNNLGTLKRERKDFGGAVACFDRAIELRPAFPEPHQNRARVKAALGDLVGAMADFDRAIELKGNYARAFYFRGLARRDQGDLAGAMADLDRAIEIEPDYAEAYRDRGCARQSGGDAAGAVADYDQAIRIRRDFAEAYNNRGTAKQLLGDVAGGIADLDRALELRPDFAEARYNRGIGRETLGDVAGALADYDRAIALRPKYAEALAHRGLLRMSRGEPALAAADFEEALRVAPPGWAHRAKVEGWLQQARAGSQQRK